jgi:A/G-specific adenine glycosylase
VLQQTRVSTVIPYFNTWIEKWPTIKDLAAASPDDVLSAWKGLGYYSRATRLHEGAKAMTSKPASPDSCPIPSTPAALMDVPGIGRYTAGAISSIAFGEAEAVLDGNVIRVLSRQMGIYADGKDKKITDVLWEAADLLVKSVARWPEVERSEVPGRWNQAVMELGSTVCTPRPKCDECPIQKTCRAYAEGTVLAQQKGAASGVVDIEDACTLCEQLDTEDLVTAPEAHGEEDGEEKVAKKRKIANASKPSNTISNYFAVKTRSRTDANEDKENGVKEDEINAAPANEPKKRKAPATQEIPKSVLTYCSLFPKKVPKKKPAEAASAVCIVELVQPDSPSKYLIEQRPAKGLLASLWQFPQNTLSDTMDTPESRKISAQKWLSDLGIANLSNAIHITELGTLVHIFSHLKLTMHVQHFRLEADKAKLYLKTESDLHDTQARRWVEATAMGDETLSTGMRRCWALVSSHE